MDSVRRAGMKSEKIYWSTLYRGSNFWFNLAHAMNSAWDSYYRFDIQTRLRKTLPLGRGGHLLEVGCAPGRYLLFFHRRFGLRVSGVDYSPDGCVQTRKTLRRAGIKGTVVCADFFDQRFLRSHAGRYDYVFSAGFIEHFEDVPLVLKNHFRLLKRGGYLICMVPNLQHLNKHLTERRILAIHNLSVMSIPALEELVRPHGRLLFSGYVGGLFNLGLFKYRSKWLEYPRLGLYLLQRLLLDPVFKLLHLIGLRFSCSLSSPTLMVVVRKR